MEILFFVASIVVYWFISVKSVMEDKEGFYSLIIYIFSGIGAGHMIVSTAKLIFT